MKVFHAVLLAMYTYIRICVYEGMGSANSEVLVVRRINIMIDKGLKKKRIIQFPMLVRRCHLVTDWNKEESFNILCSMPTVMNNPQ